MPRWRSTFAARTGCVGILSLALAIACLGAESSKSKPRPPKAGESKSDSKTGSKPQTNPIQGVVESARQSVVVISHFGREGKSDGVGAGWVVTADGLVATSLHVIGEGRPVTVQAADGSKLDVVGVHAWDRKFDLALLRVKGKLPPPLPLGDSDALKQGDDVVVIGNPMGLEHSVVRGVASARREIEGVEMIQVAVPIEPGNSGGPLLDLKGRVCGIMALKSMMTANLGFAVPVNALKTLLERPSPISMDRWLNMGLLDASEWEPLMGSRWRQRVDRVVVEGPGNGFGGRALCLSKTNPPEVPFEIGVSVKLDDEAGAAGLVFASDAGEKHYGFYPTGGQLRLTRFEGANVFTWQILQQGPSEHYQKGEWNQIRVRVEAERILCFVNGHQVFETRDRSFAGTRVGLCKFRETQAEFRGFTVGKPASAAGVDLPEALVARVDDFLRAPSREGERTLTDALAAQPEAGQRYLHQRAKRMEKQAQDLKRLSLRSHSRNIQSELKTTLTAAEKEIDLVQAALLLSRFDDPEVNVEAYRQHFDRMGRELEQLIEPRADEQERLRVLKKYFFQEQGFHGSRHDYFEKANSYLNSVMEYREGIPITLAVLFMELGQKVGLSGLVGHPLPGHFMVLYKPTNGVERVIDVFEGGRELTHAEADLVAARYSEGTARSQYLEPARKREIILRMARNLQGISKADESVAEQLRYLDLIIGLQPNSPVDRLDRARLRAQMADVDGAKEDIQWLLDHSPPGLDPEKLEEILRSL
jgi:serine protease Do